MTFRASILIFRTEVWSCWWVSEKPIGALAICALYFSSMLRRFPHSEMTCFRDSKAQSNLEQSSIEFCGRLLTHTLLQVPSDCIWVDSCTCIAQQQYKLIIQRFTNTEIVVYRLFHHENLCDFIIQHSITRMKVFQNVFYVKSDKKFIAFRPV